MLMREDAAMHEDLVDGHGCPCTAGKCNKNNNCAMNPNNNNQLDEDGGGGMRLCVTTLLMATVTLTPQASTITTKTVQ